MIDDQGQTINPLTGHVYDTKGFKFGGRKPGSKNKERTALDRRKKDPANEMITIAALLRNNPPPAQLRALEIELKIWMDLLEYQKSKKKPTAEEPKVPEKPKAVPPKANLVGELEKEHALDTRTERTSDQGSLGDGESQV